MKKIIMVAGGLVLLAALAGNIMSHVEQPDYELVASKQNIEIRDYAPLVLAEVETSGERKEALREGFKILAAYIFGDNRSETKMAMTAPVTQQMSEKMAMTAPVLQQQEGDKWKVRFIMPQKYNLETIPKPNAKNVVLSTWSSRRLAVIRFSGFADDKSIKQHTEQLESYILAEKMNPVGESLIALYNPPWTLFFLRRNEIMIEIGVDE